MAETGTLGGRLRRKRRESSLTQENLAAASGVSQVMIAKIEQGRRQPRLTVLGRLASALGIPLAELVGQRPWLDGRRDGTSGAVRVYPGGSPFGRASVAMQACHAYAVTREPARALKAARRLGPGERAGIAYGRHLLDVAQAHTDARHGQAATAALAQARALSPVWFRHQGVARVPVTELCEQEKRLSPALRELSAAVGPHSYAPCHRSSR